MEPLPLSPPVFAILSGLVEERSGLHYGPADMPLFNEKVSARAQDTGFDSLLDYYYFLRYDPAGETELSALIESLVVHETYFFRELVQLECLVSCIAEVVDRGERARVWCAASSTGEEPLSLAMLLAERGLLSKVDILASDLSERALGHARKGRYSERSLRIPAKPELSARWLERGASGVQVSPELISAIDWRRINLIRPEEWGAVEPCHFILCRNVLIYFRDEQVAQVVESLSQKLLPGGALFVGVSESLMRFTTALNCEEQAGAFLYRKVRP